MESTVQLIGLFSGGIAVSIAIYFQMVSKRICPFKYVAAFFLVGAVLMLINTEALGVSSAISSIITSIVYIIILVGEVIVAYKINKSLKEGDVSFISINMPELEP